MFEGCNISRGVNLSPSDDCNIAHGDVRSSNRSGTVNSVYLQSDFLDLPLLFFPWWYFVSCRNTCTVKPPNYGLPTNGNSFIRNKSSYINLFPCHLIVNNASKQRKFPYPEHGNLLNVKWRETVPDMRTFQRFPIISAYRECARDRSERQSYEKVWPE